MDHARQVIVGSSSITNISNIHTIAEGSGPNGPFQTRIWSAKEGYVRFEQRSPRDTTIAGINKENAWILKNGGAADIDLRNEIFLQGHELHLISLDPLSRFQHPVYSGETTFNEQPSLKIQFRDRLNNPVNIYYDQVEYYPMGMEIMNPFNPEAEKIQVVFQKWEQLKNGLFFFSKASFHQGGEVWIHDYTEIEIDNFEYSVFNVK